MVMYSFTQYLSRDLQLCNSRNIHMSLIIHDMTTLQVRSIYNIAYKLDCVLMHFTSMLYIFTHKDHMNKRRYRNII